MLAISNIDQQIPMAMDSNDNLKVKQLLVSYLTYNLSGQQPDTFWLNHELHTSSDKWQTSEPTMSLRSTLMLTYFVGVTSATGMACCK